LSQDTPISIILKQYFIKPSKNKKSLTWEPAARWGILSYDLKKVWLSINKSYNCQVNNVIVYRDLLKYENSSCRMLYVINRVAFYETIRIV